MNRDNIQTDALQKNRVKNSLRNIVSSVFLISFVTIMPFIIRTLMTYTLGIEYLGLNSLFMSIVQILNMTELGIGSVMVFFFYAPAAAGDREKIDSYLNALRKIYFVIGILIMMIGLMIMPFIKHFISGNVPSDSNVYFYFFLYLIGTAVQYFIYPEEISLIEAFQRQDITNCTSFISNACCYIIQIIVLCKFRSYFLYLVAVVVQSVLIGGLRKILGIRYFPEYRAQGQLSENEKHEIKMKVLSMIGHQMDEKLFNSIDMVLISSIIGLTAVAVYSNYFYVITAVTLLFNTVYRSILSSVGNAVAVDSKESNLQRFMNIFWIGACMTGVATVCMLCLYQNFMLLWMGKDNMLGMDMVVLFCIYFYLSQIRRTVVTFKNAAGMWWNDRYKPYISMALDLLLDLVLIRFIGVKGAIISSIVCVGIIEIPWETRVLFRDYFHISTKQYIIKMLGYGVVNLGIITLVYLICKAWVPETGIVSLLIRMTICCGSVIIYAAVYWRSKEFRAWRGTLLELRKQVH